MNKKVKILLAYDGSEYADDAVRDLKRAGLGSEVELLVMTIADLFLPPPIEEEVEDVSPKYVPEVVQRAQAGAQHKLEEAQRLAKRASDEIRSMFPGWQITWEAKAGSPAWELIWKADRWKPDLIVLGARGLSVFGGRLILGSISQRVLYEARGSVRIARASYRTDKPVRILIGVDLSSDSQAAVDAVCNRQWPDGSEVGLLAVVDSVLGMICDPTEPSAVKWIEVADEKDWYNVRAIFEPTAQKLRSAGLHTEILIRHGHPADQILEEADTWGADCIFVGAKGTRGIDRLLMGSVSSAVSSRAHCSVEVVRKTSEQTGTGKH
jgi:nucleotide-binding universal stress UspA family protein